MNDGVTYNYNTYLNFTGEVGLRYSEAVVGLSTFTMSIWFKLDSYPWDIGRDMVIVQFNPDAFTCQALARTKLECRSDKGSSMTVGGTPRLGQWYILIVRAKSD